MLDGPALQPAGRNQTTRNISKHSDLFLTQTGIMSEVNFTFSYPVMPDKKRWEVDSPGVEQHHREISHV